MITRVCNFCYHCKLKEEAEKEQSQIYLKTKAESYSSVFVCERN